MTAHTDQTHLLTHQYHNASNLEARIALHQRFGTSSVDWFAWVFDHLVRTLPQQARVLELGTGPARLWQKNLARIPAGWDVTLSDLSEGMLKDAQTSLADASHSFGYRHIDAQAIPFDDGRFDAVVANHMLYHVPDLPKALAEIRRVLKPGGRLLAATNGRGHMRELFEMLAAHLSQPVADELTAVYRDGFNLDTGETDLWPYFTTVTCHPLENNLEVTEVEPLVTYVRSMNSFMAVSTKQPEGLAAQVATFRAEAERRLAESGVVRITRETGLFEAIR